MRSWQRGCYSLEAAASAAIAKKDPSYLCCLRYCLGNVDWDLCEDKEEKARKYTSDLIDEVGKLLRRLRPDTVELALYAR